MKKVDPLFFAAMVEVCENGTPILRNAIERTQLEASFPSLAIAGFVTVESIINARTTQDIANKLADAKSVAVDCSRIEALRCRLRQADPEVRYALRKSKIDEKLSCRLFSVGRGSLKPLLDLQARELENCTKFPITHGQFGELKRYLLEFDQAKINTVIGELNWTKEAAIKLEDAGYCTVLSVFAHPDSLVAARTGITRSEIVELKKKLPDVFELNQQ